MTIISFRSRFLKKKDQNERERKEKEGEIFSTHNELTQKLK